MIQKNKGKRKLGEEDNAGHCATRVAEQNK